MWIILDIPLTCVLKDIPVDDQDSLRRTRLDLRISEITSFSVIAESAKAGGTEPTKPVLSRASDETGSSLEHCPVAKTLFLLLELCIACVCPHFKREQRTWELMRKMHCTWTNNSKQMVRGTETRHTVFIQKGPGVVQRIAMNCSPALRNAQEEIG